MNPDDNLKDILGFDPSTGERTEDKQGSSPLPKKGEQSQPVSPEVQAAFKKYAAGQKNSFMQPEEVKNERVFPEALLYRASNFYGDCTTLYFGYTGQEGNMFHGTTTALFDRMDGEFHPAKVRYHGERTREFVEFQMDIGDEDRRSQFGAKINARLDNRTLILIYDANGDLEYLQIRDGERDEVDLNLRSKSQIDELMKKKRDHLFERSLYEMAALEGNVMSLIRNYHGGGVLDEFEIPTKINKAEIIQNLFPKELLDDPFNAPPELDTWRRADVLSEIGIKWERNPDPTKSV